MMQFLLNICTALLVLGWFGIFLGVIAYIWTIP